MNCCGQKNGSSSVVNGSQEYISCGEFLSKQDCHFKNKPNLSQYSIYRARVI